MTGRRVNRREGKKVAKNALRALTNAQWAMTPAALETMLTIIRRENASPAAIAAELGRPLDHSHRVTVRDGVATIPVEGPLFRYANLFTEFSGATSYADLATDLTLALRDSSITAILLDIDSPGGEVNGCADFARLVYDARNVKPIIAMITGGGCSAAYWIASAASEVVVSNTAIVGCLGVVATFFSQKKFDEAMGFEEIEIVSSQTPNKRADPAEPAGRAQIQRTIDALAQVFVQTVADYRGVGVDVVLADYGQGDVFVGELAVAAGLADAVGTYEELHARIAGSGSSYVPNPSSGRKAAASTRSSDMKTSIPAATADESPAPAAPATPAPDSAVPAAAETKTCSNCGKTIPADATTCPECGATQESKAAEAEKNAEPKEEPAKEDAAAIARSAERARIQGIMKLSKPGLEAQIAALIADPDCTPEAAVVRLQDATAAAGASYLAGAKGDESKLAAPTPVLPEATDAGSSSAEAKRIVAIHEQLNAPRKRAS